MLTLYRRHVKDPPGDPTLRCESLLKARGKTPAEIKNWRRCDCPIWIVGTDTTFHRHTLNTTNWEAAEKIKRDILCPATCL
jgi:hypothetical protein